MLVHEAADRPKPSGALLWIHGGGLIMGTPEQGNALTARWADELLAEGRTPVVVYGLDGALPTAGRYLIGRGLRLQAAGLSMMIDSSWGSARLDSRLLGRFNAHNLLAALAVLLVKGVALAEAVAALADAHTVPGRIEAFRAERGPLVVVDYAHTPQALEAVLRAVRAHTAGRLICVFGCGGDRDRGKRPLMGTAAVHGADAVIVTDDNPRSESPAVIASEIVSSLPAVAAVRVIHDRAEAIRAAIAEGKAGSLSEGMQKLADAGRAATMDIGAAWWLDVDDPRAFDLAEAQAPAQLPEIYG
mgnify:CR=1 FL=1